jgi:hypothetical protein
VTQITTVPVGIAGGVGDEAVRTHESPDFRIYWSELPDPAATLAEGMAIKTAEARFRQVLREIVVSVTPIPFPFPAVVPDLEALDKLIAEQAEFYHEALTCVSDTVQYEMIATWTADEQADFASPVTGREYAKRRQEAADRIAAIDTKLKTVTGEYVLEWRSRQDRRKHHWFALVARENRERFIAALRAAGPSEGVRLRLSGPWPPGEFLRPIIQP